MANLNRRHKIKTVLIPEVQTISTQGSKSAEVLCRNNLTPKLNNPYIMYPRKFITKFLNKKSFVSPYQFSISMRFWLITYEKFWTKQILIQINSDPIIFV